MKYAISNNFCLEIILYESWPRLNAVGSTPSLLQTAGVKTKAKKRKKPQKVLAIRLFTGGPRLR